MAKANTKFDTTILEESLKDKVAQTFFSEFDCTNILGRIDFSVCVPDETPTLFDNDFRCWGESKKGEIKDFKTSFVQLILTIGKERTFDKYLPPRFLCEFDAKQIAFLPYEKILEFFYQNDFNWNVAPSDHTTKEFGQLYTMVESVLENNSYIFDFLKDENILRKFIKDNFKRASGTVSRISITRNNFISIYNRWTEIVKPHIAVDWNLLKSNGIIDADFYLADIMSKDNAPILQKLQVLLVNTHYRLDRKKNHLGLFSDSYAEFNDEGVAHSRFWKRYNRPPKREYQDYMMSRRDLLVPQDVRERKGSYFTPQKWVDLAYEYLAKVLGDGWQDEYYVWDCCAGTGNLLTGLVDKYKVFASTVDKSDVDVMNERINSGANLLPSHVFQFDFLNDGYGCDKYGTIVSQLSSCEKIPQDLRDVLSDHDKRKKLVIFINPPYAEASSASTTKGGISKKAVEKTITNTLYSNTLGQANAELFAQFFMRIYKEIPGCVLAEFSKLKILTGPHFSDFRNIFLARLESLFVVPADTFDNVKGKFPIGFHIWKTDIKEHFSEITADVYDKDALPIQSKIFRCHDGETYMNDWIKPFRADKKGSSIIGKFPFKGNDFQNQNIVQIVHPNMPYNTSAGQFLIDRANLMQACVYYAVRKTPQASWLNDRDQFMSPSSSWDIDPFFKSDCLVYTLFNNSVQSHFGTNHWIPYSELEVNAANCFESRFMYDFITGKLPANSTLFGSGSEGSTPISFSPEAQYVLDCGRELWHYYHSKEGVNVNASFYDIRGYFQGFTDGKMNNTSDDSIYNALLKKLRDAIAVLEKRIEPKVYEYGFLR